MFTDLVCDCYRDNVSISDPNVRTCFDECTFTQGHRLLTKGMSAFKHVER